MKKTVLITGASGGIGIELSRFFIKNNYTVIGTYFSNKAPMICLSEELGRNFYYYQCDLSDFNNARQLISEITKDGFHIDLLINNAGISVVGLLQDLNQNQWNKLWNTNVTSVISLSKEIIPLFLSQGYGKIINISSVWGNCGASCEVAYSATKGAINSFTKALAKELAPSNIQVNAISCGIIATKMNEHLSDEDLKNVADEIPCGRIGTPTDVAEAVFSFVKTSDYLTGQIVTVDGGWTV
jgi:3-oxoacyl-[acyl-carrier protein] reductase